ncbi:hypothetical protein GOBAR_AA32312 [Gossypium barbadense]|uniref:Uncharacterized protein n=1 Tax=Gossypium barbadense TaxID=3634 RepID=A0A2P5WBB6_GOSBA|nr:hypothetical protein GOBAR_AA32312 [Gossypium barbadense]
MVKEGIYRQVRTLVELTHVRVGLVLVYSVSRIRLMYLVIKLQLDLYEFDEVPLVGNNDCVLHVLKPDFLLSRPPSHNDKPEVTVVGKPVVATATAVDADGINFHMDHCRDCIKDDINPFTLITQKVEAKAKKDDESDGSHSGIVQRAIYGGDLAEFDISERNTPNDEGGVYTEKADHYVPWALTCYDLICANFDEDTHAIHAEGKLDICLDEVE